MLLCFVSSNIHDIQGVSKFWPGTPVDIHYDIMVVVSCYSHLLAPLYTLLKVKTGHHHHGLQEVL